MSKNILILGGSGFISGALVSALCKRGDKVWIVTRGDRRIATGICALIADRNNAEHFSGTLLNARIHWDFVYDFIGFDEQVVKSTLPVFPKIASHYVFLSSDLVYDPNSRIYLQNEDTHIFAKSGYGFHKRQIEISVCNLEIDWTIFRPCHVYGPGSLLGCFPLHLRDKNIIETLINEMPLRLVENGRYLQQPLYIDDLIKILTNVIGNKKTKNAIFGVAGPDIITSRKYYDIAAKLLGRKLNVEIVTRDGITNPDLLSFLCHRTYSLEKLHLSNLPMPRFSIFEGLREHIQYLLQN